ncbi:PhoH Phosphate starvation-inducible protein PhoH, predicted ATPase [uncultured Caudovirales phage]|uniref:PhoH Phosphate starvation-inducible protein PhoH, predicted ATPase n=1 Tax=uncultured Caudovirales phage TaxID=2100421 RepID=A0A6J5LLZ9_9CAUD|nr:PhoH Phosphate starvation-inducible protein PhoH, predicted ATPase [uncultured Caudovirales phage]
MATNSGKKARKASTEQDNLISATFKEVSPLTDRQADYLNAIKTDEIIFGLGSAGTGKTYVAASWAARELFYRRVRRIILTRPNIETGRGLGFLPGTIEEKYAPYLEPFDSVFHGTLGKSFYENALKNKTIEPRPLGFMRGSTFDDAVVLVDEAQNCTKTELKMLLSRIGRNTKIILSGDDDQIDIPSSGLRDAVNRLRHIDGVGVVRFTEDDIVRSRMCKEIILAYKE